MRVVDVGLRQHRVQHRFHRRRGGAGTQRVGVELVDHLRVAQSRQTRQATHVGQLDRREAGGLDRLEIPAAAFDVQHVTRFAEEVLLAQLD